MSRGRWEAVLWVLAMVLLAAGWSRWRGAVPDVPASPAAAEQAAPEAARTPRGRLSVAARVVAAGDPFRLDRVPAPLGSQPMMAAGMMPGMPPPYVPPRPPAPPLLVSGIVGPPWGAVLEGVPGQQGGVLVRAGTVLGDLRVRSVTRERVIIVGPDTTWNLSVRKPWQP